MKNIQDYTIIQRDPDGFGRTVFSGVNPYADRPSVAVRVLREEDNMTVLPWQLCETDGSSWRIPLCIPQGGLYRLEARCFSGGFDAFHGRYDWSDPAALVRHVGVGDIFILAGQSNMSAYGRDTAYDPPQLGVHMFNNEGNWELASHPMNSCVHPVYCNNDGSSGTSPGLSFGRTMMRRLGVPVGLVTAARGGSDIQSWDPEEEDSDLYLAMLEKAEAVGKVAGLLWYQGCSNADTEAEARAYYPRFERSVKMWREKLGNIPIVLCQLNRHAWQEEDRDRFWGIVREAQRQAAMRIPGLFIVPTMDMYTTDGIHNGSGACVIIGERMANVLLHGAYGQPGVFAPNIQKITKVDSRTVFLHIQNGYSLRTMDDNACGMNIEDEDGMTECVKVSETQGGLLVKASRDIKGNAVFHAYWKREEPAFFVRDAFGLPMLACFEVPIVE